jgi:hypothetical protein
MATLVAFSAQSGDYILVEEALDDVAAALKEADGPVRLTITPAARQRFEPSTTYVNPARVAYLREPVGG